MELTSIFFIILAIIAGFIFYILNQKYRVAYLLLLSSAFIASYSYNLLFYIIIYSIINYFIGILISFSRFSRQYFIAGIIINLTQLIILNYATFTVDPLIRIFDNDFVGLRIAEVVMPLGISYFTLQAIGYLINVRMRWEKPEKRILHFILYIIYFPKFISGPIERSNHFLPQLIRSQSVDQYNITSGFRIILIGLFKKLIIANQLGLIVNPVYNNATISGGSFLWIVVLIQPLYLYFDFSGYTNIAIGISRVFGIRLLPNFNRPFTSENVTTFWKRFHMSLSLWFNDYVFKQVSFKFRKLKSNATSIAVLITWLFFGIWHGAGFNFIILGLLQAIAIYFEFTTKIQRNKALGRVPSVFRKWLGRFVTYFFYGFSLVFFFSSDLRTTFDFFKQLISKDFISPINIRENETFIIACCFAMFFLINEFLFVDRKKTFDRINVIWLKDTRNYRLIRYGLYYLLILLIIILGVQKSEFIYFQF